MEIPGRVWSTLPGISMLSGFFIDGSRASFHKQKPQYNIIYAMPGSGRGMPFLGRQGKVTDLPNGRLYSQKLDAVCSQFVKTYEILKTGKKHLTTSGGQCIILISFFWGKGEMGLLAEAGTAEISPTWNDPPPGENL